MDFPEFARRKLAAAGGWELGWFGGANVHIYIYIHIFKIVL